jgi:hypothetical protein
LGQSLGLVEPPGLNRDQWHPPKCKNIKHAKKIIIK